MQVRYTRLWRNACENRFNASRVVWLVLPLLCALPMYGGITITPPDSTVCGGGQIVLTATGDGAATASWAATPDSGKFDKSTNSAATIFRPAVGYKGTATIFVSSPGQTPAAATVTVPGPCPNADVLGGEIVRAVLGFEQVGASSTSSSQSFSFDFFISRPLGGKGDGDRIWGTRLRWWGDVKVSSYPYTQKTSLATFAQQFTTAFGNQNLNQLAESVEFSTGPELRLWRTTNAHGSLTDEKSSARFALYWYGGVGAVGPNDPRNNATVFNSPVAGSAEATTLAQQVSIPSAAFCPASPAAGAPACTNKIAFVPQSGDRFLRQWSTGFRLYTLFSEKSTGNPLYTSPANVEFSIGENEAVTSGHLHGLVAHVAAMYPFSIGQRDKSSVVIYLFGDVTTALTKGTFQNTVILGPSFDSNGNPIPITDPTVTQISVPPNRRDTYRLGVGIDLATVWTKLISSK